MWPSILTAWSSKAPTDRVASGVRAGTLRPVAGHDFEDLTRWWWVRHAPVPQLSDRIYGNTDPECDVSDQDSFAWLAGRLPADAVWICTHLRRTHQTAEAIGRAGHALPEMVVEADFGEQDFGSLHGVKHSEHAEVRTDSYRRFWPVAPQERPEGGESLEDVFERVAGAVERWSRAHRRRDIVCVSHGGPIRGAIAQALSLRPDVAVSLRVPNLSLTRIDRLHAPMPGGPAWRVNAVAECP